MPNKSKSRNNSRKSTASSSTASSQGRPTVRYGDDDYPSILAVTKPPSSRKNTPKAKDSVSSPQEVRPEFMEPLTPTPVTPPPPPPTPWEVLGMPEAEYIAMTERVNKMYREMERESYQQALLDDLNDPRYWNIRIEHLEREREYFNKKRGWSAADIACVESIDSQIYECEDELDRIYAEVDRLEVEYD